MDNAQSILDPDLAGPNWPDRGEGGILAPIQPCNGREFGPAPSWPCRVEEVWPGFYPAPWGRGGMALPMGGRGPGMAQAGWEKERGAWLGPVGKRKELGPATNQVYRGRAL